MLNHKHEDDTILKLSEAAAFLGVSEDDLRKSAEDGEIPAQRIGGQWIFLKRALTNWLLIGSHFRDWLRGFREFWPFDPRWMEEFFAVFEHRMLSKLAEKESKKRGSATAILKHAGVFQDDTDMQEMLDALDKQRGEREVTG